ncbi:MAG TPA: bifunctional diaminohydroxyphosphoribosylaminopyrimidine deaminase/5-amino-6-(5-phosphoribosylamino)uracil reductase RibD [Vicinamibacterales bacterium]|nr:bifunctional diaminohydroxyphosphoribosylaminopyrimidine deaminase/5-amino-6-(5-phosphoribosylamino)uracil reductase RibD [Vicinamibacterales bacterium]
MVDDVRWMRRAIEHARRGLGRTTPNPIVGACVVSDEGVVLGQGAHEFAGGPHAEINALDEAGVDARGATLYCTLEPCSHTGKTGPCTERIIAARIRRVVAAMGDPFPQVNGRGFAALRAHGIEVDVGIEHDAAVRLNQPFLTAVRQGRPFVILKAATSLDGRIAIKGERTSLTSAPALRHAQYMRAQVDAIAVGSETVLVDDPLLTAREVYRERPLTRVIFDRRGRVPSTARIFSTLSAGPVAVVTSSKLVDAMTNLADRGIQSLILEGGAAMHAAAWDARVIDYVQLYVAPVWLGPEGLPLLEGRDFSPASLVEQRVEQLGPDVLIEGYVHRPH